MEFVSWERLQYDVLAWERELPTFDAFIGVPRSGSLVASMLALRRNVRLVSLAAFIANPDAAVRTAFVRANNPLHGKPYGRRVLIVDDASGTGLTRSEVDRATRSVTGFDLAFGALYASQHTKRNLTFFHRVIETPRLFAWNWFRHPLLGACLLDMDGVICDDWTGIEKDGWDTDYLSHVQFARPLYPPLRRVAGIVSGRVERYREATTVWLAEHQVEYDKLWLSGDREPSERRRANDIADRKATVYSQHTDAALFIESDPSQALSINQRTRRPVLSLAESRIY